MKIIKEKSCSKIKIKSYLINLYLLAKIQNWPSNFHSFSFKSSNFQFCQFSLLTFNFCQCKIPLNLNYGLSLMSLKRCRFSFFFFFEIKKKKKNIEGEWHSLSPEYNYHLYSNETTFTPNSTYQSNLNNLLFSLSSNSTHESGFYKSFFSTMF